MISKKTLLALSPILFSTRSTKPPAATPSVPEIPDRSMVSRTIMRRTKLFWAPMARMVPISLMRSVTDMTRVFMMMITATTAMMKTMV